MILKTLLMALAIATLAIAQAPAPTTAPSTTAKSRFNEAGFIVSRMDVANAFLVLERALHDYPLAETDRARVHRESDRIAGLFFLNQFSPAVRGLHELADSISPDAPRSVEAKLARALRLRLAPPVAQSDQRMGLRIKISPMYAVEMDRPVKLKLQILPDAQRQPPVLDQEITVETNGLTPVLTLKQPTGVTGKYRVDLVAPDGFRWTVANWHVAERPMDLQRVFNNNRLAVTANPTEQLAQARGAVSARNILLSDRPVETEAVRFFCDPNQLASELDHEIAQLEAGKDPFVNRAGDYWRSVYLGDFQTPVRVYAPEAVTRSGKPAPLVIALHGAGGEEGTFFDAYGLGELKRQADNHGFIVVAPRVEIAKHAPDPVNALVRAISFDYAIDTKRIFAIGHSTGAVTAQSWADLAGNQLAAVVQIAGASEFTGQRGRPPTLLLGGELDLIFPPDRLQAFADKAKQRDLRVQMRRVPSAGHTLIVGEVLPETIDWLMSHGVPTTAPATAPGR